MFKNCKNSKKQGDFGLGIAISYFCRNNYTVAIPLTDSQDYDLIVENGTLQRVQVKTTGFKSRYNKFIINLRTMGGNQKGYWCKKIDKTKVDVIFILTSENEMYLIPTSKIKANSSITLGEQFQKFRVI